MRHNQVCCRNMSHLLLPHTRLTGAIIYSSLSSAQSCTVQCIHNSSQATWTSHGTLDDHPVFASSSFLPCELMARDAMTLSVRLTNAVITNLYILNTVRCPYIRP